MTAIVQELQTNPDRAIIREFQTSDGAQLRFRHWPAARPRAGGIVMLHRGHEHGGRLGHLTDELDWSAYDVFALDLRGHGLSTQSQTPNRTVARLARDLEEFAQHLATEDALARTDFFLVAQSLSAVVATTWIHDYAPVLRGCTLAAPAFKLDLGLPIVGPLLKAAQNMVGSFRVPSFVGPSMITADKARIESNQRDPMITRHIETDLLLDMGETGKRLVTDAWAITTPIQMLIAGRDCVADARAANRFFHGLGSETTELHEYPKLRHDLLGEADRKPVLDDLNRFIIQCFAKPATAPDLTHADKAGPAREEADRLLKPLSPLNPARAYWGATKLGLKLAAPLSKGIAVGRETGFDSGSALDYVYRNPATGFGTLGRAIDRQYLDAVGWQGIRQRKPHVEILAARALDQLRQAGKPRHLVDLAAGHGRYVLEMPWEALAQTESIRLRDFSPINVAAGRELIVQKSLDDKARFDQGDAFDAEAIAALNPAPTVVIVSGLYELFDDNDLIRQSLSGIARAVPVGGYLVYTNQPWHPQLEMIARCLTSHREGQLWVMRRRSQMEMDQLVTQAGFEKQDQLIDRWGIFSVSLAKRVA